ncbi:glycosyl hydrolase family 3 [Virgibacillus soli]|uniref:glycoside hydrolase family 3 N-terminal domain-containing protein n=1 Tax=Lederbergia galactosidilytica TaxID=217031 RepID=UPI0007148985|nr:glycoside hydrolase family 3 N-terminal domain-containing protein [Lederbergia galactosidilytica]KRG14762.1 glycosyl hydrolase family 3 [Virgibacillus soli]MBP1915877.1 beta-glucosidase [Lederbergia galactosidilytica]
MEQQKLEKLLSKMTLDEKIGQLMQFAGHFYATNNNKDPVTGPDDLQVSSKSINYSGSVLGSAGAERNKEIQERYLAQSRMKIPLLFMADVINGFRTIFPIPLGLGASWDPMLVERAQTISAKEASSAGIHVTFAPMVDLVRDPRWGRVMESPGEDSFLNQEFAKASVRGFQGENLQADGERVAACVKHFVGYGAVEGGRDYNKVDLSERELRENYLPAFQAALEAGCELVMTAFNTIDSIPASGNQKLMREILRKEFDFDGVLISDYGAVEELIPHGVAADQKEAARKAMYAGVDIEMMSLCYENSLKELIGEGKVSVDLLDEAVFRILNLKNKLGLFENPYRGASIQKQNKYLFCPEHKEVAQEAAEKSCVLLKNNDVLPLRGGKIALIGPYADNPDILGEWSIFGKKEEAVTLKAGIAKHTSDYTYALGCPMYDRQETALTEAVNVAKESTHIILALGEGSDRSGEGRSRSSITLPENQLELLRELKQIGKPITVVLFNGRPLDLTEVAELADGILEAWHPGSVGGTAIANLLFGKVNPSGKLTMSFPRTTGQIPVYYNAYNTGRPLPEGSTERFYSRYIDTPNEPLYPFGFGLSYADFQYESLQLSANELKPGGSIDVQVLVKNQSDYSGEEIVQLYIRDLVGEVVRPVKELKAFQKVFIPADESKLVSFSITEEMLRYHHANLEFKSDPGEFKVLVGSSSTDLLSQSFYLK